MSILTEAIAAAKAANETVVELYLTDEEMKETQVELKPYICRAPYKDGNGFCYNISGIDVWIFKKSS